MKPRVPVLAENRNRRHPWRRVLYAGDHPRADRKGATLAAEFVLWTVRGKFHYLGVDVDREVFLDAG